MSCSYLHGALTTRIYPVLVRFHVHAAGPALNDEAHHARVAHWRNKCVISVAYRIGDRSASIGQFGRRIFSQFFDKFFDVALYLFRV
jgi:hypothetical protein